jgi:hypothetical protein
MPNPGNGDAIRLIGCRGDGDRGTVDLILDVNGNGRDRGTAFDAVRIGMDTRGLVATGDVQPRTCGSRGRATPVPSTPSSASRAPTASSSAGTLGVP